MTTNSNSRFTWKPVNAGQLSITSWSRKVLLEVGEEQIRFTLNYSDFDGYSLDTFSGSDAAQEIIELAEQDDLYELDLLISSQEGNT